jgi:acyl carrier protein
LGKNKIELLLEGVFAEESPLVVKGFPFSELKCWDSLHYVQLVVEVQAAFGIELNSDQIQRLISLNGLHEVLKEHSIDY